MPITSNFERFLNGADLDLDGPEEVYSLIRAVESGSSFGLFDVGPATGGEERFIVSVGHSDLHLLIPSNRAKEAFMLHVRKRYCGSDWDMDIDSWFGYRQAIAKEEQEVHGWMLRF